MKTILLAGLTLTLAACTTYEQDAASACGGISNTHSRQMCVANYLTQARLQSDAEWETVGAMLSQSSYRRTTTCMNIGGIVTCQ
jgi:hypothetical protein